METIYVPDEEYVFFIKSLKDTAVLTGVEGKMRWVVTREDGTQYICRPESVHATDP